MGVDRAVASGECKGGRREGAGGIEGAWQLLHVSCAEMPDFHSFIQLVLRTFYVTGTGVAKGVIKKKKT